jgi:dihydroxy-acid dehydratase
MGTVVLHVTPEAALGGPLAAVRTGDRIRLSVAQRQLSLLVPESELAHRLAVAAAERKSSAGTAAQRGYLKLFLQTTTQADRGCDFDFLRAVEMTAKSPARRNP